MNEYRQQLSAMIDGELSEDEIHRLQPELEAAKFSTASRYQMIAEAMRGAQSDATMIDISDQVRVAILQEQTLKQGTSHAGESIVAAAGGSVIAARPAVSWWRMAGGAAIAASVAMALVLVVTNNPGMHPSGQSPVVASESVTQPNQQMLATMPAMAQQMAVPVNDEVRQNLNSYLNAHSEFAAQDTAQGRMPYARAVAYETER